MFEDEDDVFGSGLTLNIDADILLYKPCCIFDEDDDRSRTLIMQNIDKRIGDLCDIGGFSSFNCFVTTKTNFRNFIVDDYKANRDDTYRPINLGFAKKYLVSEHNAIYEEYLEADDLLAIHQADDTVIWSEDKDLKQVPGKHLDEASRSVITVDPLGALWKEGSKWRFSGYKGLMFQALTGDGADWIVGCGSRTGKVGKSGFGARQGVGPAKAATLLNNCEQTTQGFEEVVYKEYISKFGMSDWKSQVEAQVNLLYMINDFDPDSGYIKRWTHDGRHEYMNKNTGFIVDEGT